MSGKMRKTEAKGNLEEQEMQLFQQLQDCQQNKLLVFTTEQLIPSRNYYCMPTCTAPPVYYMYSQVTNHLSYMVK